MKNQLVDVRVAAQQRAHEDGRDERERLAGQIEQAHLLFLPVSLELEDGQLASLERDRIQ